MASSSSSISSKRKVHLFVFDGMADWEVGYLTAGIHNPEFQKTPGSLAIRTVAVSDKPVKTAGGLRVLPDLLLSALKPRASAMLVLPGGAAWDQKKNRQAAAMAASFIEQQVPVAAICGATAGLARAGLLDNVPHTSNARDYLAQTGYAGAAYYHDEPAFTAGTLITASGVHPLEFARHVFALLDVYPPRVLAWWYQLHKTGDPKYYAALTKANGAS